MNRTAVMRSIRDVLLLLFETIRLSYARNSKIYSCDDCVNRRVYSRRGQSVRGEEFWNVQKTQHIWPSISKQALYFNVNSLYPNAHFDHGQSNHIASASSFHLGPTAGCYQLVGSKYKTKHQHSPESESSRSELPGAAAAWQLVGQRRNHDIRHLPRRFVKWMPLGYATSNVCWRYLPYAVPG